MAQISVIVPVYKVEKYLHRCVDSILGQTFPDFELILVDDGSPDNCGLLCDEYAEKDSRIHVIHRENGGLSAARNSGIDWVFEHSDSQWLTFVDSDDWIHDRYLEYLQKAAAENHCLMSAGYAVRTEGEDFAPHGPYTVIVASSDDYYCGKDSGGIPSTAWAKLYARALFETLRYPVGKLHEDEFTTYKAVYASGKVAVVPLPVYAYFQNPTGIIHSAWNPRRMDGIYAVEEQMQFAKQCGNVRLQQHVLDVYIWFLLEHLSKIKAMDKGNEEIQRCRKDMEKRLRDVLRNERIKAKYPFSMENASIYELAYPCPVIWEPLHFVSRGIRKLRRR